MEIMMNIKTLLVTGASALFLQISTSANAFECPKHFAEAQAAIDKVGTNMKGAKGQISKEEIALVHSLLDDAKMQLAGAKHNHEKPQGIYDHARSLAKADAALGYAKAADQLHWKYMK
jgi:hypothetical protein